VANVHDKEAKIERAFAAAATVDDLDSFNAYMAIINPIDKEIYEGSRNTTDKLQTAESYSSWIYFAFYFLGSLLFLVGTWLED
jgi:hypothetical protein